MDVVGFDSEEEGARLICDVSSGAFFKAIVDCSLYINHKDWLWDAIGSIELDPDCGIVGGTILTPDYRILHIGYVAPAAAVGPDGGTGEQLDGNGRHQSRLRFPCRAGQEA